jgi:hypothetical protein
LLLLICSLYIPENSVAAMLLSTNRLCNRSRGREAVT